MHEKKNKVTEKKTRKENQKKVGKTTRIKENINAKIVKGKLEEWKETHKRKMK